MKRVLFVDDEPLVLRALRAALHGQRKTWEMVFVSSADAALAEAEKQPFDVVVSDMRMPDLDGPALLERVAERWPQTRRLILSGYADDVAFARAKAVAHQCLDKPCSAETLRQAIEG